MRPSIFRLARTFALRGWVNNNGEGVDIVVCGEPDNLALFKKMLLAEAPPLSKIEKLNVVPWPDNKTCELPEEFEIRASKTETAIIEPTLGCDAALCENCKRELNDPGNRRYGYAFANCTDCGPRFSIATSLPFDRKNTSMDDFPLCELCKAEYENPFDRRFHAQAICCPQCGPQLSLVDANGEKVSCGEKKISEAARLLNQGKILAIKGLGGFHLACRADNEAAIAALRQRKHRPGKPFALMALDVVQVREYVSVCEAAEQCLQSVQAPIVLLSKLTAENRKSLPTVLAPGQQKLGFMLPYTPLHLLLMQEIQVPLVMTSGNRQGEPQCLDNAEALEKLKGIADYFLLHNRRIVQRLDDSVVMPAAASTSSLRRARGYVPELLGERKDLFRDREILAMGGEQKNTLCWVRNNRPLLSAYVGDLYQVETFKSYQQNIARYQHTFQFRPTLIAVDKHPGYHSTQEGRKIAERYDLQLVEVQHHHAHIASCMLENNVSLQDGKVLGIVLDGSGYGEDNSVWGGEFILADYKTAERCGHFQQVALPGNEQAVLEPWRNVYAHLHAMDWDKICSEFGSLECIRQLNKKNLKLIASLIDKQLNSPLSSSAGRVFDTAAAMLGVCFDKITFEGEAAMQLEALAYSHFSPETSKPYPFGIQDARINWQPLWISILRDLKVNKPKAEIAARFHQTIARAVCDLATVLCAQHGVSRVALSGGVFQNALLLSACHYHLQRSGLRVLDHKVVPANDGGIALGQAVVAAQH